MSLKTIAAAVDAVARRSPQHLAIVSPYQEQALSYGDLSEKSNALAAWLSRYGYAKKDLLVSDLPNVTENLVLQLACNRLGVGYGTAKSLSNMAQFPAVRGAVASQGNGFLAETNLPLPTLSGDFLVDLIEKGDDNEVPDLLGEEDDGDLLDQGEPDSAHGFYNTTTAYTNRQALAHGADAASELTMTKDDIVCVSITLCHPFGIGSAVCAALTTGATIALPAVGGIQGCGVPSERAAATLDTLTKEKCSLLFCDTHTLKALPSGSATLPNLRSGVCKTGSGSTFLAGTVDFGGATLRTVGKPSEDEGA